MAKATLAEERLLQRSLIVGLSAQLYHDETLLWALKVIQTELDRRSDIDKARIKQFVQDAVAARSPKA